MRTFAPPFRPLHFAPTPPLTPPDPRTPGPPDPGPPDPRTPRLCPHKHTPPRGGSNLAHVCRFHTTKDFSQFSLKLNLFENRHTALYSTLKVGAKWGFSKVVSKLRKLFRHQFRPHKSGQQPLTRGVSFLLSAHRGAECDELGLCEEANMEPELQIWIQNRANNNILKLPRFSG